MKRSSAPRKTAALSESIHHQLNMYALAAGAAGVGVLALAQASQAKIVYTKANFTFHFPGGYSLDLNHDGAEDFKFFARKSALSIFARNATNSVWGSLIYVSALSAGVTVGPNEVHFRPYNFLVEDCASTTFCRGGWYAASNKYLGLKFYIKGKPHYGWARLSVHVHIDHSISAKLTGYAYETIPNKPIIAGKTKGPDVVAAQPRTVPGSLGELTLGRK
jgi:hypothetical protein